MDLKQLGLSEYEEKAYLALVKLGKSSASEVSKEGEVSYGKIYEVLSSLERKGLVKVVPEKTKKFIASDPTNLIKIIENKEEELKKLKVGVKELKQTYETHETEVIQIVKGKKNFYRLLREIPATTKINYGIKYTSEFNPEIVGRVERKIKKGLIAKALVRYDDETKKNVQKWLKVTKNIKKFDNQGVAMDINDRSVFIALINNNTSILIKDKAFVEIMKTLFENTYKNAESIK